MVAQARTHRRSTPVDAARFDVPHLDLAMFALRGSARPARQATSSAKQTACRDKLTGNGSP